MSRSLHYVHPEQLRIGVFVQLDLGWMDHPFAFSEFRIKTEEQLQTLRQLGLERVRYDPAKSIVEPLPESAVSSPSVELEANDSAPEDSAADAPLVILETVTAADPLQRDLHEVELRFQQATATLRAINKCLDSNPKQANQQAQGLVSSIVESLLSSADLRVHSLSETLGEDAYFHSLNVAVLAMILGKAMQLPADQLQALGVGAVFHDIGQTALPGHLFNRAGPLNSAEQRMLQSHTREGEKIGIGLGLSPVELAIIAQHHESVDGSGYPAGLNDAQIAPLAKIVAIVNRYDNLCNSASSSAIAPSEALSQMFAFERGKFDQTLLRLFIRCLGVYPPGSVVQLSNDEVGLVLSVDSKATLKPLVKVFDPRVPRDEARIVDLQSQPGLKVIRAIKPVLLSREVSLYLSPRKHVTYYFDPQQPESRP